MIPLRPSSITSGTAPWRVAITGVPHAIDSIMTSPNGSSHSIGKSVARASWSNSTFSPCVTSPRYSIRLPRCGSTNSAKYCRSFGSRFLPAIFSGRPSSIATAIARCAPLSGLNRPRKSRYSPRCGLLGYRSRSIAFGIVAAHGRSGIGRRWFSEIEISFTPGESLAIDPYACCASVRVERPVHGVQDWSLEQAAERGCRNPRVVVDHVELVRPRVAGEGVAHLRQRAPDQLARRLLVDVREFRLRQRVAGREQRHVVAGVDEPVREQRDDELDAPVAGRRHGEPDRRQNGDAQLVTHSARPERCHPRRARPNSCRTRGSR